MTSTEKSHFVLLGNLMENYLNELNDKYYGCLVQTNDMYNRIYECEQKIGTVVEIVYKPFHTELVYIIDVFDKDRKKTFEIYACHLELING